MDQGSTTDWRKRVMAASNGPDPKKLISSVGELLKMLDDRNRKTAYIPPPQNFERGSCGSVQPVGRAKEPACENGFSLCRKTEEFL